MLLDFGAIHKHAVAIAHVFDVIAGAVHDDGGATARDAAVGELDAVVGFAAADEERGMRYGDGLTGLVRGDHFNECVSLRGRFRHGVRCGQIVTRKMMGLDEDYASARRSKLSRIAKKASLGR